MEGFSLFLSPSPFYGLTFYLLQYQLETFTEGRQTTWDYEPYTGELPQDGRREERGERRRGEREEGGKGRGEGRRRRVKEGKEKVG